MDKLAHSFCFCSLNDMTDSKFMITCSFPSSNLIRGTLDPVKSPGPAPAMPPLSVVGANEPNCSLHPSNYLSPPRARCTPHSSLTSRRLSQVSPNQSSVSPLSANQGRASPGEPRPACAPGEDGPVPSPQSWPGHPVRHRQHTRPSQRRASPAPRPAVRPQTGSVRLWRSQGETHRAETIQSSQLQQKTVILTS